MYIQSLPGSGSSAVSPSEKAAWWIVAIVVFVLLYQAGWRVAVLAAPLTEWGRQRIRFHTPVSFGTEHKRTEARPKEWNPLSSLFSYRDNYPRNDFSRHGVSLQSSQPDFVRVEVIGVSGSLEDVAVPWTVPWNAAEREWRTLESYDFHGEQIDLVKTHYSKNHEDAWIEFPRLEGEPVRVHLADIDDPLDLFQRRIVFVVEIAAKVGKQKRQYVFKVGFEPGGATWSRA